MRAGHGETIDGREGADHRGVDRRAAKDIGDGNRVEANANDLERGVAPDHLLRPIVAEVDAKGGPARRIRTNAHREWQAEPSPDGRSLALLSNQDGPESLYVMDLATMSERPITGETRSIDDQLEWLDDGHVLYGAPRAGQPSSIDVWTADIDGGAPARLYLKDAESPIVVR